jgi:hypothetical protein
MLDHLTFTQMIYENCLMLGAVTTVIGVGLFITTHYSLGVINNNLVRERIIDSTRVEEGLPTDITLTPEDFRLNPQLAEIFEVTDTTRNLDIALESNEHFQDVVVNQYPILDNLTALFDSISNFIGLFF